MTSFLRERQWSGYNQCWYSQKVPSTIILTLFLAGSSIFLSLFIHRHNNQHTDISKLCLCHLKEYNGVHKENRLWRPRSKWMSWTGWRQPEIMYALNCLGEECLNWTFCDAAVSNGYCNISRKLGSWCRQGHIFVNISRSHQQGCHHLVWCALLYQGNPISIWCLEVSLTLVHFWHVCRHLSPFHFWYFSFAHCYVAGATNCPQQRSVLMLLLNAW